VAIVEFALVLPILMLLIVAIFDFGRALNYWADTTHLASEGARMAAVDRVPPGWTGSLQEYIADQADSDELKGETASQSITDPLSVCITSEGDEVGDPVKVEVTFTYHWNGVLGLAGKIVDPTTVKGTATMRRERVADVVEDGCE
jgi:hypothetical protein